MLNEKIAEVCHEVNRVFCEGIRDFSQPKWANAPRWQKDSAINGVKYHLENDVTPEMSHINWMKEKAEAGWVYGEVKDPDQKTHPCMVPYVQLPSEQQVKDHLFKAVVDCFREV